jgi:y4mF family transcriptional regulator
MQNNKIGKKIKERREFLSITQAELAEISNTGLRSLVDIENDKGNPTLEQLQKILDVLGLTLEIKVK